MTPEERLALINKVSQRILDMPDAERQAYQQQYGQAINDMLAEYNQIKASQKQEQMEARNRGDSLADMYKDADGNVIGVHNDGSQVILEAAPRRETPKRRQTPPKDREVKETIIEETTPIEVSVEKPELTGYKTEDPRYAKGNNNEQNGSGTGVLPWLIGGAGLGGLSYYGLYKNYGNKQKALQPETVGQSLVGNSKSTKVDSINQRMAGQQVAEPVEGYHTSSTVKTKAPKIIKTTVKNGAKEGTKKAVKEGLNKAAQKTLKLVF